MPFDDASRPCTRRELLALSASAGAAMLLPMPRAADATVTPRAGRIRQSASRWPYSSIPLPEFCKAAREMGLAGIDLLGSADWPVVRDAGLVCSMGYPTDRRDFIAFGFNDPAHHPVLLRELEATIPVAAKEGVPNVIAMFGNREGRDDQRAVANCVLGLNAIKPLAEQHGVTICLELLNSKVDHKDYQGDRTSFGVAVVEAVASPRVKLLYDIYHMQIMEGDVIRTIRTNARHLAHFHTGGVPGRHELDDQQELNWPAVARAIADTGFTGFVAHEFVPTRDPLTSLRAAVAAFTV
jgi:hydroxypyruvate isomerase